MTEDTKQFRDNLIKMLIDWLERDCVQARYSDDYDVSEAQRQQCKTCWFNNINTYPFNICRRVTEIGLSLQSITNKTLAERKEELLKKQEQRNAVYKQFTPVTLPRAPQDAPIRYTSELLAPDEIAVPPTPIYTAEHLRNIELLNPNMIAREDEPDENR
jgi:hypothetical protein